MPDSRGAAMPRKKQQKAQHNGDQQTATVRRQPDSKRAQKQVSMTTEYRERFLQPSCYSTIVSTSKIQRPYHQLKGTSADTSQYRSFYVSHKWMSHSSAAPCPPAPAKDFKRRRSNLVSSEQENQTPPEIDFTTIYNDCFKAWKVPKRKPFKLEDNLTVKQGFSPHDEKQSTTANSNRASRNKEPKPFESITSYRADYTAKIPQGEGRCPNQRSRPATSACVFGAKPAWDVNRELISEASEFLKQFSNWTLETKFHGHVRRSGPPADHKIQSRHR
ncbi:uncharacterized protein LOC124998780 [Mugil cephalus]|uniref:uncharacterized protein LOC124998780 n=1 Tax=Mugil cephalus TaxID=48193 RepID=UPI001FB709CC|nr:uncharacterized protein LOC124998780 [Mugil cephalus]